MAKIANEFVQFFCTLFAHFHTSIKVAGQIKIKKVRKNVGIERYTPDQNSTTSLGSTKSKTKQLPSPAGKKEIPKLYHSPWVPVDSPGGPGGRPTGEQMKSALISPMFVFNLHMYGRPNEAIVNSYYLYSVLYSMFNYLFNIQLLFSVRCFSSTQLVIQCSIIY